METTHLPKRFPTVTGAPVGRDLVIHLSDELGIALVPIDDAFWTHAGITMSEMSEGRILCVSDYTSTWTWWECHPDGDELVYLLSGDVDFELDDGEGIGSVPLRRGEAAVVPTGVWHRAVIREAGRMLFITPTPARTLVREIEAEVEAAS